MEFVLVLLALALSAAIAFGIVVLVTGTDPGLVSLADGVPPLLPSDRPLAEKDVLAAKFDTGLRGYQTSQVDDALSRLAYDVGFKDELIKVLASEVTALRDGRTEEADSLRQARERALGEADEAVDAEETGAKTESE
ncbi:MAG: DivIVA domain-containing protein, partial [Stackebrandtia sp.]